MGREKMTNKLMKWDLFYLEKAVKNDELVEVLEYILKENNQEKVMEVIKASGYFISYSEDIDRENVCKGDQSKKVDAFIRKNMREKNIKQYEMWKKEAEYLRNKRSEISLRIDDIINNYYIDFDKLILFTVGKFGFINCNSKHIQIATQEHTVFCLGGLIKALMYQTENNDILNNIPEKELENLWELVFILREINEIIQSWMFGNVEIEVDETGISITELQGRNAERIISSLSFWDIKDIKDEKYFKEASIEDDDLSVYEKTLKSKVQEYFYTENFQEIYLGLKLCKWIDIYKYFKSCAIKNKAKAFVKLNIEQLRNSLNENGFSEEEINIIEEHFIFSKSSRDLFDSFMIKHENTIYFIPQFYDFIDPSQAMISLFSGGSLKSKIGNKGKSFENYISNLIKSNRNLKVEKNISANEKGEIYEIDLVFQLNDILFFCECKTQFQHQDMRGYFRNRVELERYLEKFKRNYAYFTQSKKGMQIIKQKMGLYDIGQCVPVFISNIVYPDVIIDNIYITDEPRIWRYMKRQPALIHQLDRSGDKIVGVLFEDFYKGVVNAKQFISYLNNKEEEIKLEYRNIVLYENKSLNHVGIYSERYIERK